MNVLTWCLVPYLIVHFIVGHKEARFLFPMMFSFTYLITVGINDFIRADKYMKPARWLFMVSIVINIPLLLIMMFIPAEESINCYNFLYEYSRKSDMTVLCKQRDVYELSGLYVNFYRSPSVHTILLNNDAEISNYLQEFKPDSIFLVERNFLTDNKYAGYSIRTIYGNRPQWIVKFNFNNWISKAGFWKVQELRSSGGFNSK
jgi:phosphatidylinositol glycan class B